MAQHISIRVPWHDDGWKGSVCKEPSANMACLKLKNIIENRDDAFECSICGQCMVEHEEKLPCISEGGAFMSDQELHKDTVHPYKQNNPSTHGHFLPTEVIYPPYSFPARPFAWLMHPSIDELAPTHGINYDPKREPVLGFNSTWVQEAENHKAIFKYFYQDVIPDESLCIAYAKQVPFVEDNRRVVIGMGHVKRIVPAVEHKHTNAGSLRSMIWETMICHSIREDHKDGFVIPYQEMMEYAQDHPDFDMSSITVFAPSDAFDEFSYATEHLSHDAVIDVLLGCIKAFTIINECLDDNYSNVLTWLNEQLAFVWEDRGAFPGLGVMLSAFGIQLGIPMAREIKATFEESYGDFWEYVDAVVKDPQLYLSEGICKSITPIVQKTWKVLCAERKQLFHLLCRFALNLDQANTLFYENQREKKHIYCSDRDIIENPYILYEQTRLKLDDLYLSVQKVDRAVFPVPSIAEKYPLQAPSCLSSDNDERRVRAVVISILENAAVQGHTFLPCNILIDQAQNLTLEPACPITADMITAIESFMSPEVMKREMKDGTEYYKLLRLNAFDIEIEKRVRKRLKATKIQIDADWRKMLDEKFGGNSGQLPELEELARNEKAAVLKVLAESRVSVLVGDAGTGKTTVLSVLCSEPSIEAGGVMLLAPTGKATVRLMESVGVNGKRFTAYNVAQFLTRSKRFDWNEMRFRLSKQPYTDLPETVIIDEASMLTEEMFGALMEAIGTVKRIIFVGDPNQLPPIGSGKPFVDLVNLLREELPARSGLDTPRVCNCYGELRINRRQQKEEERLDVNLSRCFTRTEELDDEEDIISEIIQGKSKNIQIKQWETREELEALLFETVSAEIGMLGPDDQAGFDRAFGANVGDHETFFNKDSAEYADKWQIMAPVRNMPQGVLNINRLFHQRYRSHQIELSRRRGYRKCIPVAYGAEEIVYGDKVINVQNISKAAFPDDGKAMGYVANGEIGIACGTYKKGLKNNYLNVCFSSQKGYTYSYDNRDFDEESGTASLELAYALTVHKSQGSQFNTVILVLAEPCRIISRELLYTALTRQVDKIIILYNQEPYHLMKYASEMNSDIAKRFTDLFADVFPDDQGAHKPQITKVGDTFFDEKLIHKTARGELVRSKSEVIIADALFHNGLDYQYEPELVLEGRVKRPDFKIIDADTGEVWYWEHCGMMSDTRYAKRWHDKEKFYAKNGIERGKNLIVTEEFAGEGLDSHQINEMIKDVFLL